MARRIITIELDDGISDDEYAKLANVIWSVATMSEHFRYVSHDGTADNRTLNKFYDKVDGANRWGDA